jgi:hypothetical protein
MDLRWFSQILNSIFQEGGKLVVLLHVGSTLLVKGIALAVATIKQVLEGRDDVIVHGVNLVPPKELGAKTMLDMMTVLCGPVFLHMLTHA